MKNIVIVFGLCFFMMGHLQAQENNANKFDPIIKKLGEATELLKKSLTISEDQKKQARELFDKIKGNFNSFQDGSRSRSRETPDGGSQDGRKKDLPTLRKQINAADEILIKALADRMRAVQDVGELKKQSGMSSLQKQRWNEVLERATEMGAQQGLSKDFVRKIMNTIHEESLRIQDTIQSKK